MLSQLHLRRPAQGKPSGDTKRRRKAEPAASGAFPSDTSGMYESDDGASGADVDAGCSEEGHVAGSKDPLQVNSTSKSKQPSGKRKGLMKAKPRVDKENATPEIAWRAAAEPVEARAGR